ncbi:ATP-grasp fold amidoligase family protein [Enterovibrio norvegicus]|uniref:Uncharacterized protein n=1 Tax=Enterovibrio norvegicus TaxID=188144 RepID=A0A2N7LDL2_9GAMM|nr:ATP-grasp fold amidoligase family protein [Enterovibrio norvegicus]PMN93493.1 hypothetical protein BCT23_12605 [Enterovibrio norvegicus]
MIKFVLKKILPILPISLRIKLRFVFEHGYWPNLRFPKTFSEKIQARKLELTSNHAIFADKYLVREYVREKIGEKYLVPLLWHCHHTDFKNFPNFDSPAVIKTNHGSGSKHLEFIPTNLTNNELVDKFKIALNEDYIGGIFGESQYSYIERRIVVEKLLSQNNQVPHDFKFHVFKNNGKPIWFLQVDFDRFMDHKRNYYDSELNLINLQVIYRTGDYKLPEGKTLHEMASIAFNLLGDLDYARIDLYYCDNKIFFGEITLTPGSGFERFSDKGFDTLWGSYW